jgi:hypothetical protein
MECFCYIVFDGKISVLIKEVDAVTDWLVPTTQNEVRSIVQFCNFYAKLIHYFSDLTAPFLSLLQKFHPQKVSLTPACLQAFETLKLRHTSAPCVILPEVSSDPIFTVAICASIVGIAGVIL